MRAPYLSELAERENQMPAAEQNAQGHDIKLTTTSSSKEPELGDKGLPTAFTDPNVTQVPLSIILALHANRTTWIRESQATLKASAIHRKGTLARVGYLNVLFYTKLPLIKDRYRQLQTHGLYEKVLLDNLVDWEKYFKQIGPATQEATKHANWCRLLEEEYEKINVEWIKFWDVVEAAGHYDSEGTPIKATEDDGDAKEANAIYYQQQVEAFGTALKAHCKKQQFLQAKILETRAVLVTLNTPEPEWWEMVSRSANITNMRTGECRRGVYLEKERPEVEDQDQAQAEDGNDAGGETENGHVEELDENAN